jgi:hypothetical protein
MVNPTKANLVLQAIVVQMVATIAAYAKNKLYHNQHFRDVFLPFAMEVFGFLH